MAAVARVDILDDLLAALVLEIDIDVGRFAARFRDEALEQQVDLGRVHRRDVEAIADDGVRSRATPLAQDAERACIGDDVVNGQEVRGEFEIVDEGELFFDGLADFIGETIGEMAGSSFPGQRLPDAAAGTYPEARVHRDIHRRVRRARNGRLRRSRASAPVPLRDL